MDYFDITFQTVQPMTIAIIAESEEDAKQKAAEIIENLSKDEQIDRFLSASEYGYKVVAVEKIDEE